MTPLRVALSLLFVAADSGSLNFAFLRDLANDADVPQPELLNRLAHDVATMYAAGVVDFEAADRVMNAAFAVSATAEYLAANDRTIPQPMFTVYQAFDEGEYGHPNDTPEESPELKYTRPMVQAYLRKANDA